MSLDGVEIRPFRAGDEPGILETVNSSRRAEVTLEDWSWSYPPLAEGRTIVVALVDGRIVAHVGGVVSDIQLDDRTVPGLALVDDCVLESVGAAGERDRLLAEVTKTFLAEFGGGGGVPLIYRLAGDGENGARSGFPGGTGVELPHVDVLSRRAAVSAPVRRFAFRAEPARDWEPRLDRLWRRVRRSYSFAAVRDAEESLHRHAGHPVGRRHRFLVFPRFSRHAVAFAVFETNVSRCRWVDLVWDHDEPGALDLLSHLSRRLASQTGAMDERIVLGGDAEGRRRLEKLGFRREGVLEDLSLTVFSLPPGVGIGDLRSRCYVTQTDLDPLRRLG